LGAIDPRLALAADVEEDRLGRDLDHPPLHHLAHFQGPPQRLPREQRREIVRCRQLVCFTHRRASLPAARHPADRLVSEHYLESGGSERRSSPETPHRTKRRRSQRGEGDPPCTTCCSGEASSSTRRRASTDVTTSPSRTVGSRGSPPTSPPP